MGRKATRNQIRKQRQRRRAGVVRRVEFVLTADSDRDHDINDHLNSLPRGAASEFIKQAIAEKMQRERQPDTAASEQFNAILRELADLRQAVRQPEPVTVGDTAQTDRRRRVNGTPQAPQAPPGSVTSAPGIDTSGPPPRATRTPASGIDTSGPPPPVRRSAAPTPEPVMTESEFTAAFLASARGFTPGTG